MTLYIVPQIIGTVTLNSDGVQNTHGVNTVTNIKSGVILNNSDTNYIDRCKDQYRDTQKVLFLKLTTPGSGNKTKGSYTKVKSKPSNKQIESSRNLKRQPN